MREVIYGNVGAARRLDFTATGAAEGLAARVESLTRSLQAPLLATDAFAQTCVKKGVPVDAHTLRGFDALVALARYPADCCFVRFRPSPVAFAQACGCLIAINSSMIPYRLQYAPDNGSLIIQLALEARGLSYETILVERATGQQGGATYRTLNTHDQISTLETPQDPIFETGAILLWLAETHGGLGPALEQTERGAFLKWFFFLSNTVHSALRMPLHPEKHAGPDLQGHAVQRAGLAHSLKAQLSHLDALAATCPDWLGGAPGAKCAVLLPCLLPAMVCALSQRPRARLVPYCRHPAVA